MLFGACSTQQNSLTAVTQFAVMELAGGRMAVVALANYRS